MIEFCKAGFNVTGFDIDAKKVALIRQGKSYIKHIDASRIAPFIRSGKGTSPVLRATTDFSRLADMDCVLVCVPTPLNKNREPDMTYVFNTTKTIARYLRKGQLIVLESTTYPGTTDEDMRSMLEESGLKAGVDFFLAFSPEREDPNNSQYTTRSNSKGGRRLHQSLLELLPRRCTARSCSASSPYHLRRLLRPQSCWRISIDQSTSRWLMS